MYINHWRHKINIDSYAHMKAVRYCVKHYVSGDPEALEAYYFPLGTQNNEIRLVVVSESRTKPQYSSENATINFGVRVKGFLYTLIIIDLNETEWRHVLDETLSLPIAFNMNYVQQVYNRDIVKIDNKNDIISTCCRYNTTSLLE
jgi:hypothetical protein